jgi:GrpB-like predicted nucleotidyltransferase (UPF0157 family)
MLIHPYSSLWPVQFEKIKQELAEALNGLDIKIEHVGSTAVPNLAAKPIIDIDIIYRKPDFETIKEKLHTIGYEHRGDQGIEDREVFKCMGSTEHPVLDSITHHLYACTTESEELQRHLHLRDHLRKNPAARLEYEKLKYRIAEEAGQDRKKYAALKEIMARDFILSILQQAKER